MNQVNRRQILGWTAMASSAIVVAAGCGGSSGSTASSGSSSSGGPGGSAGTGGDAASLNALLAIEYAGIQAYSAGAGILSNPPSGDPLASLAPTLLEVATHFQQQHKDHAAALVTALKAAGGTPIDASSVSFMLPANFKPSITNVLKLAANAEKEAAVTYTQLVAQMNVASDRFLASAISGDEAQHFIVLYVLLKGIAQPGMNLSAMTAAVVPTSFVSGVGAFPGLQMVADLAYG
jgi:hypothetical protein